MYHFLGCVHWPLGSVKAAIQQAGAPARFRLCGEFDLRKLSTADDRLVPWPTRKRRREPPSATAPLFHVNFDVAELSAAFDLKGYGFAGILLLNERPQFRQSRYRLVVHLVNDVARKQVARRTVGRNRKAGHKNAFRPARRPRQEPHSRLVHGQSQYREARHEMLPVVD